MLQVLPSANEMYAQMDSGQVSDLAIAQHFKVLSCFQRMLQVIVHLHCEVPANDMIIHYAFVRNHIIKKDKETKPNNRHTCLKHKKRWYALDQDQLLPFSTLFPPFW